MFKDLSKLFVSIFLFCTVGGLVGCVSLGTRGAESIVNRLEAGELSILASCEFYNSAGQVVRKYPGDICVPIENGDLYISDTIHLSRLDKNNQVIWSRHEPVHHQMKRSFNKRDLFFITGYYETNDTVPIRQDMIKVIDSNGEVLRQFDFSGYLKSQDPKYIEKYKYKNTWSFNGSDQTFYEYTHVNSIDEITSVDKLGQRHLEGYVVNDRSLGKVFIFDRELKLKHVINFDFQAMHDVSFLDQNTLIYFLNSNREKPATSAVETYNVRTKQKRVVYGNGSPLFFSKNNGGVQPLSPSLFLVSHAPKPSQCYVELISNSGEVFKKILLRGSRKLIQDAELGDYLEFLKNNVGN